MGSSPTNPSPKRSFWNSDKGVASDANPNSVDGRDFTSDIPDELLACVFRFLRPGDRKSCTTVCRRWIRVENASRHHLYLIAYPDLLSALPSIFTRFDSVTRLTLRYDHESASSASVSDEALVLISTKCTRLKCVDLYGCRELTDRGVASFAANCKTLRRFLCDSCSFGTKGIKAVIEHCVNLEEISIKWLRGIHHSVEPVGSCANALRLKSICLEGLVNGKCFAPLLIGAKNLETLRLIKCSGDWDDVLHTLGRHNNSRLSEVALKSISVSDVGVSGVAHCKQVKSLYLQIPRCSNVGLTAIGENCKLLRKFHIDGIRAHRFGVEGLAAILRNCVNLREVVLIRINAMHLGWALIASNCKRLKRLGLCYSENIRDTDISCIAAKCKALRVLVIWDCPISDIGFKYLALGCPNLVKVKVRKCEGFTNHITEWLKDRRRSLVFVEDNDPEPGFF